MKRNFHLLFIRQALYLLIGFVILEEYFILLGSDQPLQNVYGLTFDNSGMAWSNEEINILASWLGSLPPSLATIGKKSPYGFIRVIKEQNYSALPAIMMQSGFTETKFATLYLSKSKDLSINEIKMQISYCEGVFKVLKEKLGILDESLLEAEGIMEILETPLSPHGFERAMSYPTRL